MGPFEILFLPLPSRAICYFPDGKTVANQDTPCHEGNSTCCGQGFACLSNNICMLTPHVFNPSPGQSTYVRGSCTDPTWKDANCPSFCITPSHGDTFSGAMGLEKCDDPVKDVYYCLDNVTRVHCSSSQDVVVFQGRPTTVTIIGVRTTSPTTTTSSLITSTSSTSSTSSNSTSPSATVSPPSSFRDPTATPRPTPSSIPSHSPDYRVAVGAGVGVSLGVIGVGVLILSFLRYQHVKKRTPQNIWPPAPSEAPCEPVSLYELPDMSSR